MKKFGAYLFNVWLVLDMLANVLSGGRPGEVMSLRFARAASKGKPVGCFMCRVLHWFDPHHCRKTIQHAIEKARATLKAYERDCKALA